MSIASWIHRWADSDRVAFRFEGEAISYADLASRIEMTAVALASAGVKAGDRVGFCGLNRVELFEVFVAASRLGAIFLPFNNRLTAAELRIQIDDSQPSIVLVTDGFASLITEAARESDVPEMMVRDLDEQPVSSVADPGTGSVGHALTDAFVDAEADQTVLMVYTSGTTGAAKGAMLSYDALHHTVLNSIEHQGLTADDRIIAPLPTFHVGGLNIQTLPTLFVGGEVLLQRKFDPVGVLELLVEHDVTQTLLVPAMLDAVAAQPAFAEVDLEGLSGINTGSSIVPEEVMAPYFERGVPVGQVYGATETGPTAVVLKYDEAADHIGSCGQPAAHTELRIVDSSDNDVPDGTAGELLVRGPNVFSGYWQNPAATAAAFAPGGWYRTGDVGYRDADGYVFISDRIADVVISGGENVYPAEIEPILMQHPAIVEVTVIGQPDDRWGEIPVAVAVLESHVDLSIEELRAWCDDRIARFKQPRLLRLVDELPRTALGKVKKHELR